MNETVRPSIPQGKRASSLFKLFMRRPLTGTGSGMFAYLINRLHLGKQAFEGRQKGSLHTLG